MGIRIGLNNGNQTRELQASDLQARPVITENSNRAVLPQTSVTHAQTSSPTIFSERNVVSDTRQATLIAANNTTTGVFNYSRIAGLSNNPNVTPAFLQGVEQLAGRLGTQPEYLLAVMSFETGGSFSPSERNGIGATGLIQFLPSTAQGLGTTTNALSRMSATEQLRFVEKYFEPFKGNLDTLEKVYTAVLSGSPRSSPDSVLFRRGTAAYNQNPLDWNRNGEITAAEATTPVAARMVGGTSAVQQRLFDLGFAGGAPQSRFVDGAWGSNTANAVGDFQRSRSLPSTGNLDAATARALFNLSETPAAPPPTAPTPPANNAGSLPPAGLERGNNGANTEKLQERLVQFGHLSRADQQTGIGIFGPKTENALKEFQLANALSPSGKFDNATRKAMEDILSGIGRNRNPNQDVTRGLQNKLVELGYMTQAQVNTAPGTFGPQTEAALKRFQADNQIQQTGVFGATTYQALQNAAPTTGGGYSEATNGQHYTVNQGILVTNELLPRLNTLAQNYFDRTGQNLHITSGYRPPARQAAAMYDLIVNRGTSHVRNLYADKTAVGQIISAYRNNSSSREAAIGAMTNVIQRQVDNGTFISSHLRSRAVDISTAANFDSLRAVVNQMGGTVINEGDHYHVQL